MTRPDARERLRAAYADLLDPAAADGPEMLDFVAALEARYAAPVPPDDGAAAFAQLGPTTGVRRRARPLGPASHAIPPRTPTARPAFTPSLRPWRAASHPLVAGAALLLLVVVAGALALTVPGPRRDPERSLSGLGGSSPVVAGLPPSAMAGAPPPVARDERIATGYHWVWDGERIDRRPQLSPDGRWAAWIPQEVREGVATYRLLVRDLDTGTERDLTPEPEAQYSGLRWSPDSRALAFVQYRRQPGQINPSELWRIDADGGQRQLLFRPGQTQSSPGAAGPTLNVGTWSPNGSAIEIGGTIWGGVAEVDAGVPGRSFGTRVSTDGAGRLETGPTTAIPPTAKTPSAGAQAAVAAGDVVMGTSRDNRRLLVLRSASNAPRVGYWRDAEIHAITLTARALPTMTLTYSVDHTRHGPNQPTTVRVWQLAYQDERHWRKELVRSSDPREVGAVMGMQGTTYTEYSPVVKHTTTSEYPQAPMVPERWLIPDRERFLEGKGYVKAPDADGQHIRYTRTETLPCPTPPPSGRPLDAAVQPAICDSAPTFQTTETIVYRTDLGVPIAVTVQVEGLTTQRIVVTQLSAP